MHLLAEDSIFRYYLIEEAYEVDNFQIANFDFFNLYGITDYGETFKAWLRKFPRPTFVVSVEDNEVVSFVYIDSWEDMPEVISVLRAQETYKKLRKNKIGYKLFLLGLFLTPQYLITKPLTEESSHFYESLGFEKIEKAGFLLKYQSLIGYLFLPLERRDEHISQINQYFTKLHL